MELHNKRAERALSGTAPVVITKSARQKNPLAAVSTVKAAMIVADVAV